MARFRSPAFCVGSVALLQLLLLCFQIFARHFDLRVLFDGVALFATHFDFYGNFERHYGIFAGCGMVLPYDETTNVANNSTGGCC